jgi:hypothetical protein
MTRPRGAQFERQWRLLVLLRRAPQTLQGLARELGCTTRTVRRDLDMFERVPLPIVRLSENGPVRWGIGGMDAWPRGDVLPHQAVASSESA